MQVAHFEPRLGESGVVWVRGLCIVDIHIQQSLPMRHGHRRWQTWPKLIPLPSWRNPAGGQLSRSRSASWTTLALMYYSSTGGNYKWTNKPYDQYFFYDTGFFTI